MIQTDLIKYQRIHHPISLPIKPPPTKKDIEANSPSAITVKNNTTSPITTKVTVYGMTVCTLSYLFTFTKVRFTPTVPMSPLPNPNPYTHTQPISYLHISNHYGIKII